MKKQGFSDQADFAMNRIPIGIFLIAYRKTKLANGSCSDDQCLSCQCLQPQTAANLHCHIFNWTTVLQNWLTTVGQLRWHIAGVYLRWTQTTVGDPDSNQVGSRSFWSDSDPSKSYGSSWSDHSATQ
jgi:hypothetical protein